MGADEKEFPEIVMPKFDLVIADSEIHPAIVKREPLRNVQDPIDNVAGYAMVDTSIMIETPALIVEVVMIKLFASIPSWTVE
jgi:hypothetical protein